MHIPEARCRCCARPGCTALQCSCRQAAPQQGARDGGAAAASRAERTSSRALRHPATLRSEVQPRVSRLEADPTQRADTAGRLQPVTAAIDSGACSFPGCHRLRTLSSTTDRPASPLSLVFLKTIKARAQQGAAHVRCRGSTRNWIIYDCRNYSGATKTGSLRSATRSRRPRLWGGAADQGRLVRRGGEGG